MTAQELRTCSHTIATLPRLHTVKAWIFDYLQLLLFGAFVACLPYAWWHSTLGDTWTLEAVLIAVSLGFLAVTCRAVSIRLPLKHSVVFAPVEVPAFIALLVLTPWQGLIVVCAAFVAKMAVSWPWTLESASTTLSLTAYYVAAFGVAGYVHDDLGVPLAAAALIGGLVAGLVCDGVVMVSASYRSGNWSLLANWRLYIGTLVINIFAWGVSIPVAYVVDQAPLYASPAIILIAVAVMVVHQQHNLHRKIQAVEHFDVKTESPNITPDSILQELTVALTEIGPLDRAHVAIVSHQGRTIGRFDEVRCPSCGVERAKITRQLRVTLDDETTLVADCGRNTSSAGRIRGKDTSVIRQLTARGATRWNAAQLIVNARWRATHDVLTGLGNATALRDALNEERGGVLILIECDSLDEIRSVLGRDPELAVVRQIAAQLEHYMTPEAQVFRIGDATFALLTDTERLLAMQENFASVRGNLSVIGEVRPQFSVGYAVYPADHDSGKVLHQAHFALGEAIRVRKPTWLEYSADIAEGREYRASLLRALRRALAEGSLDVAFQPQVDAATREVVGLEALARWTDDIHGVISPGVFIPLAQEAGLITEVTQQVVTKSITACLEWQHYLPGVGVSVNLAASCAERCDLLDQLIEAAESLGLPPELLTLELTESVVMADVGEGAQRLQSVRDKGFRISLDDFGTGYSSLALLQRLPVDEVKVDRTFIVAAERSDRGLDVLQHIVSLLQSLDMQVVAEGVESYAMVEKLAGVGCSTIQGFYFAKPMALQDMPSWLDRFRAGADGSIDPATMKSVRPGSV